ncbi:hypothetical protein [Jeotgalibacillus soli]|uniref:Uncharacterized protein n=1 Tax=Jeotgalibacillus soli TaxID=889306 RepID=A0A0C2V533_9BACL|nr:hypothetical protein [Jeotgalibacillus soli]KIL44117.1 hypothetical protein KP78_30810 [Jeotgalibacillus soli]
MNTNLNLLAAYKKMWNDRALSHSGLSDVEALNRAIKIELLDEQTHPRTRMHPDKKYLIGIERIIHSPLNEKEKIALINLYTQIYTEL